ncbi:hypothetical protein ACUUL3_06405 [Thiovibrio sp. JS02]
MAIKIILYILIILFIGVLEHLLRISHEIFRLFSPLVLIGVYFVMLKAEVKKMLAIGYSYDKITKNGFVFSFCIGILWAFLMSFAAGFHYAPPKDVLGFLWMLLGWGLWGWALGFAGKKLCGMFYNHQNHSQKGT